MLDGLLKHRAGPAETAAGRYDLSHLEPKPLIKVQQISSIGACREPRQSRWLRRARAAAQR